MQCNYPYVTKEKHTVISCGRCMGCRIRKREEWATRILLESTAHSHSAFVTLTYSDSNLPSGGSLQKRDVQLWLKRLRFLLAPTKIRFFLCGEYGTRTLRPHYHACLFSLPPERWDAIEKSWGLGFTSCSELTPARARYAARYTTKKIIGSGCYDDGRAPEFMLSSRRPGLGATTLKKIGQSLIRKDGLPRYDAPTTTKLFGKSMPLDRYSRSKIEELIGSKPTWLKSYEAHVFSTEYIQNYSKLAADAREKRLKQDQIQQAAKREKI